MGRGGEVGAEYCMFQTNSCMDVNDISYGCKIVITLWEMSVFCGYVHLNLVLKICGTLPGRKSIDFSVDVLEELS